MVSDSFFLLKSISMKTRYKTHDGKLLAIVEVLQQPLLIYKYKKPKF